MMSWSRFHCSNFGVITGWVRWSVSPLQEPPTIGHLQELLRGMTESLLQGRYLDWTLKTPGWELRYTCHRLTKPRAQCDVEPSRKGALT